MCAEETWKEKAFALRDSSGQAVLSVGQKDLPEYPVGKLSHVVMESMFDSWGCRLPWVEISSACRLNEHSHWPPFPAVGPVPIGLLCWPWLGRGQGGGKIHGGAEMAGLVNVLERKSPGNS